MVAVANVFIHYVRSDSNNNCERDYDMSKLRELLTSRLSWGVLSGAFLVMFIILSFFIKCVNIATIEFFPGIQSSDGVAITLPGAMFINKPEVSIPVIIFMVTMLAAGIVNIRFAFAPNKRSLLLAKIFTALQTLAITVIPVLLLSVFGESIYQIFIISSIFMVFLSLTQLVIIHLIKPIEVAAKEVLKAFRVIVILTCCLVCFLWGLFSSRHFLFTLLIVATAIVLANEFSHENGVLHKPLAIWQMFIFLGAALYYLLYYLQRHNMHIVTKMKNAKLRKLCSFGYFPFAIALNIPLIFIDMITPAYENLFLETLHYILSIIIVFLSAGGIQVKKRLARLTLSTAYVVFILAFSLVTFLLFDEYYNSAPFDYRMMFAIIITLLMAIFLALLSLSVSGSKEKEA